MAMVPNNEEILLVDADGYLVEVTPAAAGVGQDQHVRVTNPDGVVEIDDVLPAVRVSPNALLEYVETPFPAPAVERWTPTYPRPVAYPATPAQRRYIQYLADTKDWKDLNPGMVDTIDLILGGRLDVDGVWDRKRQREDVGLDIAGKDAGTLIEALIECPDKAPSDRPVTVGLDLTPLPAGRYAVPGGETRLKVQIDKPEDGKWAGWVFVKDAAVYGQGRRYGSQRPGGTYRGDITDALQSFLDDPESAIAAYGKLTSRCGICNRPLEDEVSVRYGIGPICADRVFGYGKPF